MAKEKIYFSEIEEDYAYTLDYILSEMVEQSKQQIWVAPAVRELKSNYFYCKAIGECCAKPPYGEPCGKECEDYEPRNGASGCCKHRGFCYTPGKEHILTIDGKLTLNE